MRRQGVNLGQNIGVGGCRKEGDRVAEPEVLQRHTQIEKRRPATRDQLAVVGIDNRQRARSIGAKHDTCSIDEEMPRLAIVTRWRQHRIVKREAQSRLDASKRRQAILVDFPRSDAS